MKAGLFPVLSVAILAFPLNALALIIAGPNGQANSTESSLNSWTAGNAKPTFSYWDNVVRVSDASGIYLGASGTYGWVMTAAHVTQLTTGVQTITVDGTSYVVRDNVQVAGQDMRLYRIGGEVGDPALPVLADVPIATSSPAVGTQILDFGAGDRKEITSNTNTSDIGNSPGTDATHFEWAGAGTLRWGTNVTTTQLNFVTPPSFSYFNSQFNDSPGAYLTSTEATVGVGDSGGPVFSVVGGQWQLSGINNSSATASSPANTSGFGDFAVYLDVTDYRTDIQNAMVPEPGSTALTLAGGLSLLTLRRRRK